MPVPKGKQELFGKIIGANINQGRTLAEAKKIADKAVVKKKPQVKKKK